VTEHENRQLASIDAPLSQHRAGGRLWLTVEVRQMALKAWCLSLAALRFEVLPTVSIRDGDQAVLVTRVERPQGVRAEARLEGKRIALAISPTELDYWLKFFLMSLRDGEAPVDHIDVDIDGSLPFDSVVFHFDRFAGAVPPDEARRRLGLP
jgi:hypothetical protein